ncbi:MAG: hypothetical protein JWO94_1301 [Verrucomicrobiaceae bacterium]|nr:hypothetical protein [Verrucomicrobiaceae bacterium]
MPSPPLPPRIALTDDLHPGHGPGSRRKTAPVAPVQEEAVRRPNNVFVNGLVFFCVVLMACLLAALWKWHKADEHSLAAARQAAVSMKFSDGVLQDLALAREQAAKLDRERANLVKMLGEAERLHANLRGELSSARQKHEEVVGSSKQALAEWNQYSQTLEKNLGTTRDQLAQTNGTLQQERTAAQQQISQVETERERAEREAGSLAQQKQAMENQNQAMENQNQALDRQSQNLDAENARLQGDVTRLRGTISSLETSNNFLDSRNAALSVEISQLRSTVYRLETRIHSLEQGKDNDKDNSGNSKRGN